MVRCFPEESLKAFLALRNESKVKLAVELDTAELLESQVNAETEQLPVATLFWMHKHGLERLALFIRNSDYTEAHLKRLISLIKMIRTSLRTVLTDQIKEIIVAVPLRRNVPVTELLQYADTIIYIAHHSVPSENCVVVFPSTFGANYSFSDMERADLLPSGVTGAVRTKRFCVSVSMAVLRFLLSEPISSVANSTCIGESWVSYDQTCLEGEAAATYNADTMAVLKQDDSYAFTFESEESLHLKARHIVDLLGAKACVAAFHVEYDAGRNACASLKHSNSRLVELASELHDKEHRVTTAKLSPEGSTHPHREGRMGQAALHGGFLICILSEKPPSPIQLPQRACSLTVYQHVFYDRTTDRVSPRDGASFRDFVELSKRDVSSRLAGAFDDVGFTVPWARDHLYPGRFARSVASWCRDYALHGVAFLPLNFSALQRAEASIRALNNMSTVRPLVVLGMPRTDDQPILNRFAPHVDVIVFITHHIGHSKPCRVTFPSSRMKMIDSSIFLRQIAELTNQLVRIHRHLAGVCVAANLAVLKFSLPPRQSDLDDSCIDEERVNYAQVCSWEGNVEYDTVSSAVLSRKHSDVLTYENEYSLETKARSYMSYTPLGCVAAFNADYEDPRGTCRQPFSRLGALDNVLGKRNRSRAAEPGTSHRGRLICVPSSTHRASVDFPFSQCDIFVDGEVEYLYNNVIKTSSYKANLQGRLLDAKLNWTCFVVSIDASKVLDDLADSPAARAKIISFITNWLSSEGLCGLAVKETARTQPVNGLAKFLQELSDEFSERNPKPILILLVSAFEHEGRLKELGKYPDFLVLTNEVPNESKDCKLHGTMTAATDVALKLSMGRLLELSDTLGAKGGVCFSTTLAVYRYRLHQGLHGAGESCRRMAETTFGEACPPEESARLVEVSSMTSYTYNKSHMLAFEDERSLRIKTDTFLSRYQRGCVAVFDADMDTAASSCNHTRNFARLKTLRSLLERTAMHELSSLQP
ncbi:uncharacterized protein [Dermacentor andersoni]|uniref:uncharacterized protein isoform X1 n=1 Tax=Dermacentor andersoni TaxID=34620 RepID=UPI002415B929|nr:uncharacterized protein LOC126521333 isoform X1 [Dermacentor andersoni]